MSHRRHVRSGIAALVVVACFALATDLRGQSGYQVTDLGVLGGSSNPYGWSIATGLNDHGQVVGFSSVPNEFGFHAFLWQDGVMTDLGSLGFGQSAHINNRGEVVLDPIDSHFISHAELLDQGQEVLLPGLGGAYTFGSAIANTGEIVGTATPNNIDYSGVTWRKGEITQLGPNTLGGANSSGVAINASGEPAGSADLATIDPYYGFPAFQAVVWDGGTMSGLGVLGGYLSAAQGINDAGQVVGFSEIDEIDPNYHVPFLHAFLWENGALIDLGTTSPGSNLISLANSINDQGEVVGNLGKFSYPGCLCFTDTGAFLWQQGVMADLNTLLLTGPPYPHVNIATAINRRGQIVGSGNVSMGSIHALLLTPAGDRQSQSAPLTASPSLEQVEGSPVEPQHTLMQVLTAKGATLLIR